MRPQRKAWTRVEVAGNADTSGQAVANQALSERRANAVAAALIRAGVPKDAIAIQAFGDTKPAVPTGPGVAREAEQPDGGDCRPVRAGYSIGTKIE